MIRSAVLPMPFAAVLLAGCSAAAPLSAPASPPALLGVSADSLQAEPEAAPPEASGTEPDLTLEERWAAPFAVRSSGRLAPRPQREPMALEGEPAAATEAALVETAPTPEESVAEIATERAAERATDESAPAAAQGAVPGGHVVRAGETWYGLALRYGVSWSRLQAANPGVDPERLRIGQTLRLPPPDEPAEGGVAEGEVEDAGARTHEVRSGDSLWGIARRYGVTLEQLRRANGLEGDRLRIGETLVIPHGGEGR